MTKSRGVFERRELPNYKRPYPGRPESTETPRTPILATFRSFRRPLLQGVSHLVTLSVGWLGHQIRIIRSSFAENVTPLQQLIGAMD